MTMTPDADPPSPEGSDPDEHNPGPGIDDSQLPEDLQPSDEDNPLAVSADENTDIDGAEDDSVSSDPAGQTGGQIGDVAQGAGEAPD